MELRNQLVLFDSDTQLHYSVNGFSYDKIGIYVTFQETLNEFISLITMSINRSLDNSLFKINF